METLERGPRKKGKRLYRLKYMLNFDPPFFVWRRTKIGVEERRVLGIAGIKIWDVPKEKESQVFGK